MDTTSNTSSSAVNLSLDEMALLTKGKWINLPPTGLIIKQINHSTTHIRPGDLYVTYNKEQWNFGKDSESKLEKAFEKGAVAAVVRKDSDIKSDMPLLLVENTADALFALGYANGEKAVNTTKILVTGSHGKTGYKTQLYYLLHDQMKMHAALNSSNKLYSIFSMLGSIQNDDELAIIELSVTKPGRGGRRAKHIQPDICVITDIGLEHMLTHGKSIDDVIRNKSEVAKGLKRHGKFIIPKNDEVTAKLESEIKKHSSTVEFLYFGEDDSCDAQLLEKEFTNFGWNLKARIEDEVIEYHIPMIEDYAPISTLPILLSAHLIGADLKQAVKNYDTYVQYKTSGGYYHLEYKGKKFYLYNQSVRGVMSGFKSTFELMAKMTPEKKGKKIAILSEFTVFEYNSKDIIDIDEFRTLINKAGIDTLYTGHRFCEHINVLEDKNIWKNHAFDITELSDEILDSIEEDDIVFMRGNYESKMEILFDMIIENSKIVKQFY